MGTGLSEFTAEEIQALGEVGYFTREDVMPQVCVEAGRIAAAKADSDELRPAGVGKQSRKRQEDDIRGDRITWVDRESAAGPLRELVDVYEWLMEELNYKALLGLRRFELQLAFYEAPNRGYDRHVDAFRGPQSRRVTAICYLNEGWKASDGGALRLFLNDGETVEILPEAGRMVVFLSDELEHQVMPTDRDRAALTAWFRGPAVI
jgi:SM-20-related protein